MNIHITDYQDIETGAMYKSIAWKDKFEGQEYGDYVLSESLYRKWNVGEICEYIKVLTEQHDMIFAELKKEKNGTS